jgi:hypothetical protein
VRKEMGSSGGQARWRREGRKSSLTIPGMVVRVSLGVGMIALLGCILMRESERAALR